MRKNIMTIRSGNTVNILAETANFIFQVLELGVRANEENNRYQLQKLAIVENSKINSLKIEQKTEIIKSFLDLCNKKIQSESDELEKARELIGKALALCENGEQACSLINHLVILEKSNLENSNSMISENIKNLARSLAIQETQNRMILDE